MLLPTGDRSKGAKPPQSEAKAAAWPEPVSARLAQHAVPRPFVRPPGLSAARQRCRPLSPQREPIHAELTIEVSMHPRAAGPQRTRDRPGRQARGRAAGESPNRPSEPPATGCRFGAGPLRRAAGNNGGAAHGKS